MQTFLPYPFFVECASVLDKKRCWKQVVEAKQILCVLRAESIPEEWKESKDYINQKNLNHPAVQMWKGKEQFLKDYYNIFLHYCKYVHKINTKMSYLLIGTVLTRYVDKDNKLVLDSGVCFYNASNHISRKTRDNNRIVAPWWLNNKNFHRAQRARLIEKNKDFYLPLFPKDQNFNGGKYLWPDNKTKTFRII